MASDGEISCTTDPNFAVIYSFLKVFGKLYGLEIPTIAKLQELIENTQEVLDPLKELHIRLLRRALKSIQVNRWERALIKFCHQQRYHQEAWEIERFSYKKASTQVKLRILKLLLEYQFTCHPKFKNAVNALSSEELRLDPIGRDKYGCVYWLQIDHEANLCMYKEDQDEETWQLIASNREEFVKIISQLKSGETVCQPVASEDSSSVDVPTQIEASKSEVEENEEEFLSPESESGNESDEPKAEKCKDITTKEKVESPKVDAPKDIVNNTIKEIVEESNDAVDKVEDEKDNMTITNETDSKKDLEEIETSMTEIETVNEEETKEQDIGEEIGEVGDEIGEEVGKEINEEVGDEIGEKAVDEIGQKVCDAIGEEIEEPVMVIKGEGNGEDCESSYFIGEEISEPVMFIYGDGWGWDNDTGNPETLEQKDNTELEETSDVDNPNEEVLNGEHANNVKKSNSRVKLNKSAKLKCRLSSVTKRSLRKQSNDNADVTKSESKKHCVRNLDKSNGSNSVATSSEKELRRDSVHEKSTDCESTGKKTKKMIRKVKKRAGMRTLRNNKEIVNSISEPESPKNSKSSIIEKRKSSVSSEHDGNASENVDNENIEDEEVKIEDTLPPKKIRLESTPEPVSHSKSENVENKNDNIENNDVNTENDKDSMSNRKKIKAIKGKLKGKKLIDNRIQISEVSKDDNASDKTSKALKRSLLNKSINDKNKSESQSDSEDEEPVNSGKRSKFRPKKIVTKSRKKIEAKIMEKCSSESEDETLYSLGKKSAKKVLKKKPKAKEKDKSATNMTDNDTPVRQSRRIAQMKIKEEADRRHLEEVTLRELKMIHKKKSKGEEEGEEEWRASGSSSEEGGGGGRARRPPAWRSDSTGPEPDTDSDEPLFEHHDEPELEAPRSDHEFSPESDLESGEPTAPLKLARTLQQGADEGFCKRCGSGEQPEWILLCDSCDAGYHASCLAPVLLLVPEGDWFCPPCNHEKLISALEEELVKYDELVAEVSAERELRARTQPDTHSEHNSDDKSDASGSGSGSGSGSEWSSSSGAVYRLRARRQLPVSYRSQEYDRLISSAIKEEYVEPTTSAGNQGRGKDISTIIEAAEEEKMKAEREARDQGELGEAGQSGQTGEGSQRKVRRKQRRKPRKLNSLDVPSEDDDETDEDFKDTGMESSSEDISSSAERDSRSSDSLPIVRPGRPDKKERTKLEESSPEVKKKKKGVFEDSSSESNDTKELKKAKSRKRREGRREGREGRRSRLTQYDAAGNVVRARVTYGGLSDGPAPNDWSPKHRTRQRKINYTEMPNTESEDEMHKSSGKHMTDSSDEFRVTDDWDNSSSGSERAKRPRGEGEGGEGAGQVGEEERRRALCDLVTKTAVVPLEKLPEHVTREKTEQLQNLFGAQQAELARAPRGRGGRGGGRGSRGPRGGRGRGGGSGGGASKATSCSDDSFANLVGVKIRDLREIGEMPMRPNQAERDRKRQEREAKQAEKEARRIERLQKKEEKEKLKEQRAKEREEKKLARIALQESRRVKREKVEYMSPLPVGAGPGGMRPPPPHAPPHAQPPPHAPHDYRDRFPATPRLQVRAELRGIALGDDRMQLMHRPEQAPPREGTLSVAGSPQPFKPAPEEPSLITRMPHMLNHQYRGPMMYPGGAGGSSGYGPRSQNMMYQLHPGMNRAQYPQGYYQHLRAMPPAYPGHPPAPALRPASHGPPVSSPLQYTAGPHAHPGSSALPPGPQGNLHGPPVSSHGAPGVSLAAHGPGPSHGPIPPNMQGPRPHMPHAGSHPMGPGHMGPRGPHGPHNSSINPHGSVPGPPGLGANGSIGPNPHGPLGSRLHGPPGMHGPPGHGPPGPNPLGPRGSEDSSPHRPGPSPLSAMAHNLPPGLGPHGPEAQGPIGPTALPVHRPPLAPGTSAVGLPHNSIPEQAAVATRPGSAPRPPAAASPGRPPHPPGHTPASSSSPPVSAEPPIQIKAEVKTEPEYRTPPGSPSHRSPSPEPLRNHPKIKHTDNKDRRPRYPLGPYAPQYGPYGPYAPPGPQPPDAAMNLQARPQHPSPLQRIHANMAQYLPALADKPETRAQPSPFLQHMRPGPALRPPYGAPSAPLAPRYADLHRPAAPTPPPLAPHSVPSPAPISPDIRQNESPKITDEEEEGGEDSRPSSPPETKPDFSRIEGVNKMELLKAPARVKAEAGEGAAEGGEFGGLVSYFSSQREEELDG